MSEAQTGNVDEAGTIVPKKIVTKDNTLVDMTGKPLQ